jgi:acylphosphatase
MSQNEAIIRIVARGRVQGVGYRVWAAHKAALLGLAGFVRNRRDGSVEALFAGPSETVETMVDLCRRGPLGGRVHALERHAASADELSEPLAGEPGSVGDFKILPTV